MGRTAKFAADSWIVRQSPGRKSQELVEVRENWVLLYPCGSITAIKE
jgi:hypothetical protein